MRKLKVGGFLTSFSIGCFKSIYADIAETLNEWENHQKPTEVSKPLSVYIHEKTTAACVCFVCALCVHCVCIVCALCALCALRVCFACVPCVCVCV